jgi:hypothetical protein
VGGSLRIPAIARGAGTEELRRMMDCPYARGMAFITQTYNDAKIIAGLKQLRPDLRFPDDSRITKIEGDEGGSNSRATLVVEVTFGMSDSELREILDAARD